MSDQHEQQKSKREPGKLSGQPIYRRAEGYVTATRHEIDGNGEVVEIVTAIDSHGHEHEVSQAKVSKGREKHILELYREHLKMIDKHQENLKKQLEEIKMRQEEAAKQRENIAADVIVFEERNKKTSQAE